MRIKHLPAGYIIPAQPVVGSRPPSGAERVHEIKHDGYRMIVRRDGPIVRIFSRNAYDWTVRLRSIAAAAERVKAKSFTIDGEAVVMGPDGLSRFDELRRRAAARAAVLYAFDLIEYDGEDLKLSAPENLFEIVDKMTSGNSSKIDNRAVVLCFVTMAAAGQFVMGLCDRQKEITGRLQHYLRNTNLDVITAETIVWIHFLMERFWKADDQKDHEMFERIGRATTGAAFKLVLQMIEKQTGFDFKARAVESKKLYLDALKDQSVSFEPFATTVFRSVWCRSLADPLKKILAPPLDLEWTYLNMNVSIFYSTMPLGLYETFKNFLREWPDRFPSDEDVGHLLRRIWVAVQDIEIVNTGSDSDAARMRRQIGIGLIEIEQMIERFVGDADWDAFTTRALEEAWGDDGD